MPFAYYDRLSPARQRTYRRSDEIGTLSLPAGVAADADIALVRDALAREDAAAVRAGAQRLIDALVARSSGVPPIRVRVLARRPADGSGELHDLYEPEEGATPAHNGVDADRAASRRRRIAISTART